MTRTPNSNSNADSNSPPSSGEEEDPLTAARDRFQASAREIMRNIESVMGSGGNIVRNNNMPVGSTKNNSSSSNSFVEGSAAASSSLELAFRTLFASCTTGAAAKTTDDDDTTAADVTPVSSQPSQESSLSSGARSFRIPTMMMRMPPHGTTNNNNATNKESSRSAPRTNTTTESSNNNNQTSSPPPNTVPVADHIYEHLFFAEVQARREQQQQGTPTTMRIPDELPRHNNRQTNTATASNDFFRLSQPFPVSSPLRGNNNNTTPSGHAITTIIPQCPTFDDTISAISAHTLEAMHKQHHQYNPHQYPPLEENHPVVAPARVTPQRAALQEDSRQQQQWRKTMVRDAPHSEEPNDPDQPAFRTFFPPADTPSPSRDLPPSSRMRVSVVNPRTHETKDRHGTPHSRSSTAHSSSNASKSFDHWQTVEQQFWDSVVQEDSTNTAATTTNPTGAATAMTNHNKRRRRKSGSRAATGNSTLSTASSTAHGSWMEKHPHETFPYHQSSDLFFNNKADAASSRYPDDEEEAEI